MLPRLILGLLAVVVVADNAHAQGVSEPLTHDRSGPTYRWRDIVGRSVTIEGLAWGWFEKGLGQYVMVDGVRVYVEGRDEKVNGRLVRVTGVLTIDEVRAVPPPSKGLAMQGSGTSFRYWKLTSPKWEILDRVEWPWMRLAAVPTAKK